MRIGIVGAGMAGLSCAEGLANHGHDVVLLDKGRGPGGRMSTRRTAPLSRRLA
jgi:predicted NAD/FAD-dependent oxidoreductase